MQRDPTTSGYANSDSPRKRRSDSPSSPSLHKRARVDYEVNGNDHRPMQSNILPPLSLSVLNAEPFDEFIKEVADFVHHMVMTRPNIAGGKVEVEAKLGIIISRSTNERLNLPVRIESMLEPAFTDIRFESNMPLARHKHYNEWLNKLMIESKAPAWRGTPLVYTHVRTVDSFYPSNDPQDREKVRVTRDAKTNDVIECMRKIRLGDLNIYSPKHMADWRVSVNLEVPVAHPVGTATHTRKKDRVSYSHEECTIDLTQVTTSANPPFPAEVLHELEVEITRSSLLLAAAEKRGDPNAAPHERDAFDELVRVFVNNTRILVRNGGEH